jgi:hypothetical protein
MLWHKNIKRLTVSDKVEIFLADANTALSIHLHIFYRLSFDKSPNFLDDQYKIRPSRKKGDTHEKNFCRSCNAFNHCKFSL